MNVKVINYNIGEISKVTNIVEWIRFLLSPLLTDLTTGRNTNNLFQYKYKFSILNIL
jgi:hypothetical protein